MATESLTATRSQPGLAQPPRLIDRVRTAIRARHYSSGTEEAYIAWIKRYFFFHNKRYPA